MAIKKKAVIKKTAKPVSKTTSKNSPSIKAIAGSDDAVIIWRYPSDIKNCYGFALFRQRKGEGVAAAEPVISGVGFEGDEHADGEQRPTTAWPLQRFLWNDYYVKVGDQVCYQVIPMLFSDGKLVKDVKNATAWSNWITVGNSGANVYYTRGLVASQFVSRYLLQHNHNNKPAKKDLDKELADIKSPIRKFMGGTAYATITGLLDEVAKDPKLKLYAALYELQEPELIKKLIACKKRANIILANGAFGPDDPDPQATSASKLKATSIHRRKVSGGHFAHNKFVVVTKTVNGVEKPVKVLTGSTNWTPNGLFTQVNNVIVFEDAGIGQYYLDEWNQILKAKDAYPASFKNFNKEAFSADKNVRTWFVPTLKEADLAEATALLQNAKKGILFLMFKPGGTKTLTLYNEITKIAAKRDDLLIQGVINADPGGKETPTISFMHKGKVQKGSFEGVSKATIKKGFEFWLSQVGSPAVTIHSKLIVIDPFSDNPVVMTGSHNLGKKASDANDDNLNIITNGADIARAYAVHMLSVYHHYRWNYYRASDGTKKWSGNVHNDSWQQWYWHPGSTNWKELNFWW